MKRSTFRDVLLWVLATLVGVLALVCLTGESSENIQVVVSLAGATASVLASILASIAVGIAARQLSYSRRADRARLVVSGLERAMKHHAEARVIALEVSVRLLKIRHDPDQLLTLKTNRVGSYWRLLEADLDAFGSDALRVHVKRCSLALERFYDVIEHLGSVAFPPEPEGHQGEWRPLEDPERRRHALACLDDGIRHFKNFVSGLEQLPEQIGPDYRAALELLGHHPGAD